MKNFLTSTNLLFFLYLIAPIASGTPELSDHSIYGSGVIKELVHQESIVLTDGFWAKSGADVTAKVGDVMLLQMTDDYPCDSDPCPAPPRIPLSDYVSEGTGSVEINIGMNMSLPNPASYYAITTVLLEERSNNPCFIRILGKMVDPTYSATSFRVLAEYELEYCKGFNDFEAVGFDTSDNKFIRAVNVCGGDFPNTHNPGPFGSEDWKIKGVEVKPGLVYSNGQVKALENETIKYEKTNCPNHYATFWGDNGWIGWDSCPKDAVATGLFLFHKENRWFTGLTLKCQYPKLRYGPVPKKDTVGY